MCDLSLVGYHTVVAHKIDVPADLARSQAILDRSLEKYPRSALHLYFYGRLYHAKGDLAGAIPFFQQ
jgi:hypothetical protein